MNTMSSKKFFIILLLSGFATALSAATLENDPYPLFFLQRNLSRILVNDNISPPVASRNYVYPHIAANDILSHDSKGKRIVSGLSDYPLKDAVAFEGKYSSSLAASFAFEEVAVRLIYTAQPFIDSFAVLLDWYKTNGLDPALFENSKRIGKETAAKVIAWMNRDGFAESRRMNKYVLLKSPGKWQLTSPGFFAAVEPHWGKIRPMVPLKKEQLDALLPIPFDTASQSSFYREAKYVYDVSISLTEEQKLIASFWDCNPFALKPVGHITAFVKKISPGGHWMNIVALACKRNQLNFKKTSEALTLCAITMFNAFIYTWDKKYEYDYLRPETFIEQLGIDYNWQPYIQSPPFPEFPSGHAVISNAAAGVLTALFGKDYVFTDNTETDFGLPERTFASFEEAAAEATISRVYGGIHFLFSCKTGQEIGKIISRQTMDRLYNR